MNKQYTNLNGIRALACIGIVLLHILTNLPFKYEGWIFEQIIPSFTNFVFLFMIISAFSMCCGYYEKIKYNEISINTFYLKRYKKLFPFFIFVSLLDFLVKPSILAFSELFANGTLIFGLLPYLNFNVIGVGWYLGILFVFYMLFPFFCFLIWDKRRAWISFALALLYHYISTTFFGAGRTNILYSGMFFVIGGLIYLYKEELEKIIFNRNEIYLIFLLIFILYISYLNTGNLYILMITFASITIFAISNKQIKFLNSKLLSLISQHSLEIYLSHMMIFNILVKLKLHMIFDNVYFSYIVITIFTVVGSLFISYLFNYCFKLSKKRRILIWQKKN